MEQVNKIDDDNDLYWKFVAVYFVKELCHTNRITPQALLAWLMKGDVSSRPKEWPVLWRNWHQGAWNVCCGQRSHKVV